MRNQARLMDNSNHYLEHRRGAARDGEALLVGLVACGRCGRKMHVEYKTHHHYVCSALAKEHGVSVCLYLSGADIDAAVVVEFFDALQPAELALRDEVLADQRAGRDWLQRQYADQVAHAEYEARLAQRQYNFGLSIPQTGRKARQEEGDGGGGPLYPHHRIPRDRARYHVSGLGWQLLRGAQA